MRTAIAQSVRVPLLLLVMCAATLTPRASAQAGQPSQFLQLSQKNNPARTASKSSNASNKSKIAETQSKAQPGVGAARIVVGNLSPVQGDNTETGNAVRAVLSAYFAELNQRGGIHGRQVQLRFGDPGNDISAATKSTKQLAAMPVFALVSPFAPGAERDLAALAHKSNIPVIGLMALSVPDEPSNRDVFYLLPGFEQMEQDLIRFFTVQGNKAEKTAVVVADSKLQASVAASMQATWKELNSSKPRESLFSAAESQTSIHDLQSNGVDTVFFIGDGEQATQWIKAAGSAQWFPKVLLLGPLMDDGIFEASAQFQGKIFAAYPQLQPELGAIDQFEDFLQRNKLSHDHRLIEISAYCAAKILEDALTRAGRNVTREKLIESLEEMRDYKTGLMPGITFGVNRHIGSLKTEIVCADLVSHSFQTECGASQKPE